MADTSSREKVQALLSKGVSPKDIAERLDMSVANVYAHKRKIEADGGAPKRGRGRPPKVQSDNGETKTEAKSETKATRPAPGKSTPAASSNGHGDFQHTLDGLDQDLAAARKRVATLEKMREALAS